MDIKKLIEAFLADPEKMDPDLIYNEFSLQFELGIFLRENGYKVYFEKNINSFIEESFKKGKIIPKEAKDLKNFNKEMNDYVKEKEKTYVKHEMDLCIINGNERYAIELKFPTNGLNEQRAITFIKDLQFMELVKDPEKELNFTKTYCLLLVKKGDDFAGEKFIEATENTNGKNSDKSKKNDSCNKLLYSFFRSENESNTEICATNLEKYKKSFEANQEKKLKDKKIKKARQVPIDTKLKGSYQIQWEQSKANDEYWFYLQENK